jgi:hypothetical protein
VLLAILALTLLGLLCFLTLRPIWHPNTHLLFFAADDGGRIRMPAMSFVEESFTELQRLEPALFQQEGRVQPVRLDLFESPGMLDQLSTSLPPFPAGGGPEILIFYVRSHGISYNDAPYLLCDNFDVRDLQSGLYPVAELIRQIQQSPAKVKLLILDAGHVDYDPRLGILLSEFPRLLQKAVEDTEPEDSSLWVLCSHSEGEKSQLAFGLRQSVFSHFVTEGLRGAADLDRDREIDVGELYRFVAANVAAWVEQYSGGNATQTPMLIGKALQDTPVSYPVLISVSPLLRKSAEEEPQEGT